MLAVVGRGRSAFAIQVRSSSTRCLLKKAYKYNNNRPLPLPPPRFDSVCVAYTQKENVRGTAKPTQSCLQCVKERERERWGENSCKRILNINKLYEASVRKEKAFDEGRGSWRVSLFL